MNESPSEAFPSFPKRIIQVFFSPGDLFAALRDRPAWAGVMTFVAVLVGVSLVLIPTELWIDFSRARMMEQGQEIPPGFESSGPMLRIFSVLGGLVVTPIMMVVLAGIVTFVFSFIFGDDGRFKQYLSVVAHASVISGAGALLLVPLKIAQGDPSLTLSLGTFAVFLGDGYLGRVLERLDLFALWSYAVMAIGVSRIDPRRSLGFPLAFFMAFALAFALIFGSFGG